MRHVGLAPEDEQHVDAAGPRAHRPPVLLHPEPHHGVLEILNKWWPFSIRVLKLLRILTIKVGII